METTPDTLVPPEPEPAAPQESAAPAAAARRPRSRWLLRLIGLIVLAAAAWLGWQAWQQRQLSSSADQAAVTQRQAQQQQIAHFQQQIDGFSNAVDALGTQRSALRDRLSDSEASNRRLQDQVAGLSQRVEQLEAAVSGLSREQFSGHDGMLLDDAEMLLQLAAQRDQVLHDSRGAANALALAAQAMDGVDDASYAGVRQRIASERAALAARSQSDGAALAERLGALRTQWPELPLKPLDRAAPIASNTWQRVWQAVSGLVTIRRDDASTPDDARLARQLAALDLATAQAALLAHDAVGARAALARAKTSLMRDLDPQAPAVVAAGAELDRLLAALAPADAAPLPLGAALTELRNVRGVQAVAPVPAAPPVLAPVHPLVNPPMPATAGSAP
ncbi:MAG TPA: uroporphyrinogen-III C-methyltransferase [Rhodanobacteraceae bacterium]|nr:uroporphyrinogen-III C-methyltransferase [Rhodanobacteraceae bacterium]